MILIFVPANLFLFLAYINQWGNNPLPLVPFLILTGIFILINSLFYKLTIELDGSILKIIYGIGLIKINFRIDEIVESRVIKTPWYYGLGIRITPKGMLYNIQGSKAIRIKYISNGKSISVMVGSPEPERLKQVLDDTFKG